MTLGAWVVLGIFVVAFTFVMGWQRDRTIAEEDRLTADLEQFRAEMERANQTAAF